VGSVYLDPEEWVLTGSVIPSLFVEGPPKIVAIEPAPGSALPAGERASFAVTFHRDVALEPAQFSLRDHRGVEHELSVTYDADAMTATVASTGPLARGRYSLTISSALVDAATGIALDGEIEAAGGLPSGDGLPGGDAVVSFSATGLRRSTGQRLGASD
jgi:hypothetical protein